MATLASSVRWGTETPAIYFDVSYTASRSGANMVYTVNVDFQALTNAYGRYFGYPIYLDLSLDGVAKVTKTTVKNASPGNWSAGQVYYHSTSFSVAKTTGTTALVLKIYSGDGSSRSQSYSYSLPVSPAGSVLSLPSAGFTIGSAGSISITRYDSSFTDTVTYSIGSATGTITTISSGGSTSFSWTPAASLYTQMAGATSKSGTITITTKSGATTVGTASYTFTLKGYAPSTLSWSGDIYIGTAKTINITRNNSSFYDTITYAVGTASGTLTTISSGGSTTYSWTPAASLYTQLNGATSKAGTITITTKTSSSGTTVGTSTYTFSLKGYAASSLSIPSLTVGTAGSITVTRNNSSFYDTITYTFGSASGTIGTISSGGSTTQSWTPPATLYLQMVGQSSKTGTMTIATKTSASGTSVGSRSYTFTLNAGSVYNIPKVTLAYQRGTGTGGSFVANDSGTTLKVTATITVYGGQTASYTLKLDGTSKDTASGLSSVSRVTYIENVSTQSTHILQATLTDTLGKSAAFSMNVTSEKVPINLNVDYPGIAFGKISEHRGFECNMPEYLFGDLIFDDYKQSETRSIVFGNADASTYHHMCSVYGGNPTSQIGIGLYDSVNNESIIYYNDTTRRLSIIGDTTYTLTRTNNSYVDSTSFGRLAVYRRSNINVVYGNLNISTGIPTGTALTEIGTISGYSALTDILVNVPAQDGSGVLLVDITYNGSIQIANLSGSTVTGFCRFSAVVPAV